MAQNLELDVAVNLSLNENALEDTFKGLARITDTFLKDLSKSLSETLALNKAAGATAKTFERLIRLAEKNTDLAKQAALQERDRYKALKEKEIRKQKEIDAENNSLALEKEKTKQIQAQTKAEILREQAADRAAKVKSNESSKAIIDAKTELQKLKNEAKSINIDSQFKKANRSLDYLRSGAQKLNKALSFNNALHAIRLLERAFKTLYNTMVKFVTATRTMVNSVVSGFTKMSSSVLKAVTEISGLNAILRGMNSIASNALSKLDFTGLIKESSELSSQMNEVQNVIDQVFGVEGRDIIDGFASTAIEKLGMSTLAAKQFAGKFGAALTSTGQSSKNVIEMSKALTTLTADLASFYDIEQDVAAEKLFSGVISGQIKPMRELGVDMTVASLKAYAAANGMKSYTTEMTAAERQALRLQYAQEKLAFAAGDYARTINSTANQMRLLKNQLKELGTIVGAIINAFLNPMIQVLNRVAAAATVVAKTIAGLFGIDWTLGAGVGAVSTIGGVGDAYDDLADSADDLSDAQDGVADSTSKAAKEAKKALAPFHKLNILQNKTAQENKGKGTGSGSDGGISITPFQTNEQKPLSILQMLKNLKENIKGAVDEFNAWLKTAIDGVHKFFDDLQEYVKLIADIVNYLIYNVHWRDVGALISEVFEGVGKTLNTWVHSIDFAGAGVAFAETINGFFDNVDAFVEWGEAVGGAIEAGFLYVKNAVANIEWEDIGYDIYTFLKESLEEIEPKDILDAITGTLFGITEAMQEFFDNLNSDEASKKKIAEAIVSFIDAIATYFSSDSFVKLVESICDFLNDNLDNIKTELEERGVDEKINKAIQNIVEAGIELYSSSGRIDIGAYIWEKIGKAIEYGIEYLKTDEKAQALKAKLVDFKNKVVEEAKAVFADIAAGIKKMLFDALDNFDGSEDGDIDWGSIVSKIYNKLKGAVIEFFTNNEIPIPLKIGAAIVGISSIASKLAPIVNLVGNIAKAFEGADIAGKLTGIGNVFKTLSGVIGSVSAPIVLVITGIVAAITELWTHSESFRNAIGDIFNGFKDVFTDTFGGIAEVFGTLKDDLSTLWSDVEPFITPLWESFRYALDEILSPLAGFFIGITDTIKTAFQGIGDVIKGAFEIIGGIIHGFVTGDWSEFTQGIKDFFSGLYEIITAPFDGAFTAITTTIKIFVEAYKGQMDIIQQYFGDKIEAIYLKASEIINAIANFFTDCLANIKDAWSTVSIWFTDNVWTPLKDAVTDLVANIKDFFSSLVQGIEDIFLPIITWFENNIWNPLVAAVEKLGKKIHDTFIEKVEQIKSLWDSAKSSVTRAIDSIKTSVDKLWESLKNILDTVKDIVSSGFSNIVSGAGKIFNSGSRVKRSSGIYANKGAARGAIIQANKPQMLLVGDQRSGVNIESPLSTMVEAFKVAAQNIEGGFSGNITIPVYVDGVLTTQKVITAEQMHNYRSNGR